MPKLIKENKNITIRLKPCVANDINKLDMPKFFLGVL